MRNEVLSHPIEMILACNASDALHPLQLAQKCGAVLSPRGGYPPPHGPVAQRIERRTSNPCAEVRLLPGPSSGADGTSAAAHKPLPRDGRARSSRLVQARGPATLQGGSQREVKARRQLWQIVAKLTSPAAKLLSRRERCARSAGRPIPSRAPHVIRCGQGAPAVRPNVCEVASARGRAGRPWARRSLRVARPRRRHPTERHHLGVSVRICFHEAGWPVS